MSNALGKSDFSVHHPFNFCCGAGRAASIENRTCNLQFTSLTLEPLGYYFPLCGGLWCVINGILNSSWSEVSLEEVSEI